MKTMKKILSLVMVVAMLMAVCSVGVFAAGTVELYDGSTKAGSTLTMKVGETKTLTAKIGEDPAEGANWSSNATAVLTAVNGVLTARKAGTATVTVTANDATSATLTVTVEDTYADGIEVDPGEVNVARGGSKTLTVKFNPPNVSKKDITWTSSDDTSVSVTNGVITGIKITTTPVTVTATYTKGDSSTVTATCLVTVKDNVTITFNANDGTGSPATTSQNVMPGEAAKLNSNTFKREGYKFMGWSENASATSASIRDGDNVRYSADVTLYAVWTQVTTTTPIAKTVKTNGTTAEKTATTALDDIKAKKPAEFAGDVTKIEITSANGLAASKGTLTVDSTKYTTGTVELKSTISFTAGTVAGTVTVAYKATVASGATYTGTIVYTIQSATKNIAKTASASLPATITPADFAEQGKTLRSVTITGGTPTSIYGTLTNTYGSFGLGNAVVLNYAYTTPYFTYTPSTTYVNAGTVSFTYKAEYTDGSTVTGTITITITSGGKVINYTATAAAPATFNANDFTYYALTGQYNNNYTLSQVSFDMSSKLAYYYGTLTNAYYSNWGTAAGLKTTTGAYVGATRFTPSVSATNGMTVEIPFTAYYTGTYGAAAQTVSGTVRITIGKGGTVNVTTAAGTPYTFKGTEFDQAGATLSTIQFTSLPTAFQGGLYYNYNAATKTGTPVTTADIFSRTGSTTYPYNYKALLGLTFVPGAYATNGTQITIPFSATYSNSVVPTTGTLVITIGTNNTVNITTNVNTPYTFKGTEFDQTGATLSYVQFTSLPTTLQGGLYYNYNAATKTGTAVTTADVFYKTAIGGMYNSKILSGLTFVPSTYATNGTTITIPFTAYYSNSLTPVTGNLVITIGTGTASVKITYSPAAGSTSVTFNAADFQAACTKALGSTSVLQSVRFQLPTHNTLYYKANTTTAAQTVKATDVFNYSAYGTPAGLNLAGVYLSYQGFAPTSITYVGTDTTGRTFTGTVVVAPKTYFDNAKVTYKTGMYKDVTESKWYGTQQQGTIKSIVQMGLMKGYETGNFMPEGNITLAEAVAMAARLNSIYNGGTGTFTQASGSKWYQVYVDYCVSKGIIKSNDFTNYNAKATRAQMAYIFANAVPSYELVAINNVTVPDVKTTDSYGTYIYRLYNAGVLTGYKNTAGYKNGAFAPATNITRAEVAAIVSRIALPSTRVSQSF